MLIINVHSYPSKIGTELSTKVVDEKVGGITNGESLTNDNPVKRMSCSQFFFIDALTYYEEQNN